MISLQEFEVRKTANKLISNHKDCGECVHLVRMLPRHNYKCQKGQLPFHIIPAHVTQLIAMVPNLTKFGTCDLFNDDVPF